MPPKSIEVLQAIDHLVVNKYFTVFTEYLEDEAERHFDAFGVAEPGPAAYQAHGAVKAIQHILQTIQRAPEALKVPERANGRF